MKLLLGTSVVDIVAGHARFISEKSHATLLEQIERGSTSESHEMALCTGGFPLCAITGCAVRREFSESSCYRPCNLQHWCIAASSTLKYVGVTGLESFAHRKVASHIHVYLLVMD